MTESWLVIIKEKSMSIGHEWPHFSTFVTKLKNFRTDGQGQIYMSPPPSSSLEWEHKKLTCLHFNISMNQQCLQKGPSQASIILKDGESTC